MRRLRDYQEVTLILDGIRAPSTAVATSGDRLWLEPRSSRLARAVLPAAAGVSFAGPAGVVLLSGQAELHPSGCIEFRSTDAAHLRNTRETARLAIGLDVTLAVGDRRVDTATINLGRGGLLARTGGLAPPGSAVEATIHLPGGLPDITAASRVVRTSVDQTALAFLDLPEADGDRLEEIVLSVRRRFATESARERPAPVFVPAWT